MSINGELAEEYGYVNRSFDDDKLDPFVDASRLQGFPVSTARRSPIRSGSSISPASRVIRKSELAGTPSSSPSSARWRKRTSVA